MSAHHEELQEIENVKHFWRSGGKWLFAVLVLAALGYLGYVIYQGQMRRHAEEAAAIASQLKGDASKLSVLQQQYQHSPAAAQASLMQAKSLFDAGQLDEAAAQYRWVLSHQKAALFQASAMQNLAAVLMQQGKFDEALAVLDAPIDDGFASMIHETRGDVLVAQNKAKEAAAAYQLAIDKLPAHSNNRELLQLKMLQL